jgi:hypothetical protein
LSFSEDDKKDISNKIFDEAKTNNFIISEERARTKPRRVTFAFQMLLLQPGLFI